MPEETKINHIPKTVWTLGIVSLLMDTSSEIIHGLLPVFLVGVLGSSFAFVGFIDGLGEAISLITKLFSGTLSDYFKKRKPFVLLGYGLAAVSKPLFALSPNALIILLARISDRVGKGIRGAPRDALIADVTPENMRGKAFGLRQSLDTVGAFLGPLLAIGLMASFADNYRIVFAIAIIPALIAVGLVFFAIKEPEPKTQIDAKKINFSVLKNFSKSFWVIIGLSFILQMARISDAFLILRAKSGGLNEKWIPLVLVIMNIVYSITAYPFGWLSDRIKRENLLILGCMVLLLANYFLASGSGLTPIFIGISLSGLHLGLTQSIYSALIADNCPQTLRGTAFGFFNLITAFALFISSLFAGVLWDIKGPEFIFNVSTAITLLGIILLLWNKYFNYKSEST